MLLASSKIFQYNSNSTTEYHSYSYAISKEIPAKGSEEESILPRASRTLSTLNYVDLSFLFRKTMDNFDKLYEKRSFVHWFVGEGLESGEMSESSENFRALIRNFEEVFIQDDNSEDEEE